MIIVRSFFSKVNNVWWTIVFKQPTAQVVEPYYIEGGGSRYNYPKHVYQMISGILLSNQHQCLIANCLEPTSSTGSLTLFAVWYNLVQRVNAL